MQYDAMFQLLNGFHAARILVLGDVMLDRFVYGSVERISPEAPIPVLSVERVADMPAAQRTWPATLRPWAHAPFCSVSSARMPRPGTSPGNSRRHRR